MAIRALIRRSRTFQVDLDGTASFDTSEWQDVGNGIFIQVGAYGVAALNKGGASAGDLLGAGWVHLGNGIFEKDVGSNTVRVSSAVPTR